MKVKKPIPNFRSTGRIQTNKLQLIFYRLIGPCVGSDIAEEVEEKLVEVSSPPMAYFAVIMYIADEIRK